MPVTLSDEASAALEEYAPNFKIVVNVVKDITNTDLKTFYNITEHVQSFGTHKNQSTIVDINWKIPTLTMIVNDVDELEGGVKGGLYNPHNSLSIWNQDNVRKPIECLLGISAYVITMHNSKAEHLLSYSGKIDDAFVKETSNKRVVEIKTTMSQNEQLEKILNKEEGQFIHLCFNQY